MGWIPGDPALTDDIDLDTIGDLEDNCTLVANTHQLDTDDDGFGNICDADLDNSGNVDFSDFTLFSVLFGTSAPGVEPFTLSDHADFNGDGQVDFGDFTLFSVAFGRSPGPAAP